uniref:uncharacterized protein LOC120341057 isoform X1 n=1 Tax=Styela clava TaxID=7725 RepID=UPI0019398D4E|nr:uncharacterized protein LOC120341057 isoform X1 [Styela clava]
MIYMSIVVGSCSEINMNKFKLSYIIAVAFTSVACLLMIFAMSSTDWINGCIAFDPIHEQLKSLQVSNEDLKERFNNIVSKLRGSKICLHCGLFQLSVKFGDLTSISLEVNMSSGSVIFCAIFLMISIVSCLTFMIPIILTICRETKTRKRMLRTQRHIKIALILLVNATWTATMGMVSYAAGSSHIIHSPQKFIKVISQGAMQSVEKRIRHGVVTGDLSGYVGLSGFNTSNIHQSINEMIIGLDPMFGRDFIIGCIVPPILIIMCFIVAFVRHMLLKQ